MSQQSLHMYPIRGEMNTKLNLEKRKLFIPSFQKCAYFFLTMAAALFHYFIVSKYENTLNLGDEMRI